MPDAPLPDGPEPASAAAGPTDPDAVARLLRCAVDRHGRAPLPWVAGPLLDVGLVLDLCCGHGALRAELPAGRWLGLDVDADGARPRLRGTPTAIPLRAGAIDGIAMLLVLPLLHRVDALFAELRRVLRPGGTLVVLVPSAASRSVSQLRFARAHRTGWPNRSGLDRAGWLLAAADFALVGDDRLPFVIPASDPARALVDDLASAGFWPPGLPADTRSRLAARAAQQGSIPAPLRRLVARR